MNYVAMPSVRRWSGLMQMNLQTWKHDALPTGVFLFAVMLCGLLFGGVVAGQLSSPTTTLLSQTLGQFIVAVRDHQLVNPSITFWQRSFSEVKLFALVWLSGVSLLGLPLITLVLFVRTFSIGFSAAYAVLQFGWHGLLVASLIIFIHQLLALGCLWVAGITAIRLSSSVMRRSFSFHELPAVLARYSTIITLCTAGACVAALYQAYVAPSVLAILMAH
ncbi:MAG: stage II sporulation protein M [Coriobacteriia bacterium]